MNFWSKILTSIVAMSTLSWNPQCPNTKADTSTPTYSEVVYPYNWEIKENSVIQKQQKSTKRDISICLETDENTFTHKKVLESITDPNNTILEFPLSQLFEKYWNRPHPLAVKWIKRNFRALLWKDWIENLSSEISQKLSHRIEKINSDTQYEIGDTIRFQLINSQLKWEFSDCLADQLKQYWFEEYSDPDAKNLKSLEKNNKLKNDFIYDVVIKRLESWKSALALYRNWKIYMTTYVSVGLNSRKTRVWQFKILKSNPYYYSRKYKSPMSEWLEFDEWWFWLHQWNVTWYPASHWCVRQPWIHSSILYSLLKDLKNCDVFIDKKLYISKK